jgi:hypothetical protein
MGNSEISVKSGGKRILFTGGSGKAGRQYVSISEPNFPSQMPGEAILVFIVKSTRNMVSTP